MIVIGLTGSLGSGKTTAARFFKKKGAIILDADKIAHQKYKIGTKYWQRIKKCFGEEILNKDQTVNRKKLAQVVFGEQERIDRLCTIIHPAVIREIRTKLKAIRKKDKGAIVIIDAPLLFETGLDKIADFTVCVWLPCHLQMERIVTNGTLTKKEALCRLKNQMAAIYKKRKSDFIIDNSGSFLETEKQVDKIVEEMKKIKNLR